MLLAAGCALCLSACASGAMGANVSVDIGPSSLHLSRATFDRQGGITFNVDNRSGGYRDLLIVRFNHMTSVPLTPAGTVDVSRVSLADRLDVLAPGRYHFLSPDLTPGTYLFVSMAVPQVRTGTPIVGNQSYAAQAGVMGPYDARMSARFEVS